MGLHAVLFGGGLDSSALLVHLVTTLPKEEVDNIVLVHIDYGQKAIESELQAAINQQVQNGITGHDIIKLKMDMTYSGAGIMPNSVSDTGVPKNNVLELRNPTLVMLAASYLASVYPDQKHYIYLGLHREPKDTAFKDAVHHLYVDKLNCIINTLLSGETQVLIRAPFKNSTRQKIFRGLVDNVGMEYVDRWVHTCYEQDPCGVCTHCKQLEHMKNVYNEKVEEVND